MAVGRTVAAKTGEVLLPGEVDARYNPMFFEKSAEAFDSTRVEEIFSFEEAANSWKQRSSLCGTSVKERKRGRREWYTPPL